MKIKVENLGILKSAEFEPNDFTIICGKNNTGKTYAVYAYYGFLQFWHNSFEIPINHDLINDLFDTGSITISQKDVIAMLPKIQRKASSEYSQLLPSIFASNQAYFKKAKFEFSIDNSEIKPLDEHRRTRGTGKTTVFDIEKKTGTDEILFTLLVDNEESRKYFNLLHRSISDAVKDVFFSNTFKDVFIACAERTGAAIFRNDLDFTRNRIYELLKNGDDVNLFSLIKSYTTDYSLPVKNSVEYNRNLDNIIKKTSKLLEKSPKLETRVEDITGGAFTVKNDVLFFVPRTNKKLKLTLDESSSSVRSLLDITFFIKHEAKEGDLLIIDEPELNLHPENQRNIARLLAILINKGIKIFITTHSDYIVKELNTLIMLFNAEKKRQSKLLKKLGYSKEEILDPKQLSVFEAKKAPILKSGNTRKTTENTLIKSEIDDEYGIILEGFDDTIHKMNEIQDTIDYWEDSDE